MAKHLIIAVLEAPMIVLAATIGLILSLVLVLVIGVDELNHKWILKKQSY